MKSPWIIIALAAALTGCATVKKPLPPTAKGDIKGQTVTSTKRPMPDFAATTAGKAPFGMIGGALMISEGNGIVATHKIADPADAIAAGLVKALETSYGAKGGKQRVATSARNADEVATQAGTATRFVVDVDTNHWSFVYLPGDWNRYKVRYMAKARLIDTSSKTVMAEGECKRIPDGSAATLASAATYNELLANDAALLKKELATAAEECVKTLKAEMLSL